MPYKTLNDFSELNLKFGAPDAMNFGYTATPTFHLEPSEFFEDNFFILYRRSEFAAQKECAVAKIYEFLTGNAPEVYVVQDGDKFYVASRRIKNFREGLSFFHDKSSYVNVRNLAALHVIAYFFAETDMHSGNFGVHTNDNQASMFKIDNAESLDFEMMAYGLNIDTLRQLPYGRTQKFYGTYEDHIPRGIVESPAYQQEKINVIRKIAETDFSVFLNILNQYLTKDNYSHAQSMYILLQAMLNELPEEQQDIMRNQFAKLNPADFSHATLIEKLRTRHKQLQEIVTHSLEQDFSMASSRAFFTLSTQIDKMHTLCEEIEEQVPKILP
jgi:hypothetical protein